MELCYLDTAFSPQDAWSGLESAQKHTSDAQSMAMLRKSLGHPIHKANSVQCIVTSVHGMDTSCAPERLMVASRLWREGIAAEYLPQSGVMLSLFKRHKEKAESLGALGAVCCFVSSLQNMFSTIRLTATEFCAIHAGIIP